MKILAVSDLHNVGLLGLDRLVEGCELALLAGDFTEFGRSRGVQNSTYWVQNTFCPWCARHPETRFCVMAGEQDAFADRDADIIPWPANVNFLDARRPTVEACGLRIFAAIDDAAEIPEGVDIVMSHRPPLVEGYNLDVEGRRNRHHGSAALTESIRRAKPKLVVCGHVHGGDRRRALLDDTIILNVSRVRDHFGSATSRPRIIEADLSAGTAAFRLDGDEAPAMETTTPPAASPAGEIRRIERAEKILFKAAHSINKHIDKGDFTPNLHYIDQLDDVRAQLQPFAEKYPQVKVYLTRLDEIDASRASGWRRMVGEVPRLTIGSSGEDRKSQQGNPLEAAGKIESVSREGEKSY